MTVEAMIKFAESKKGMAVILLEGVKVIVNEGDAHKLDARGVCFAWMGLREGKIIQVPNGND